MAHRDGTPWDRSETGRFGERVAARWLRTRGCRILYRNFRAPQGGEIDIVARHHKLLLFVEVKTRRAGAKVRGFDAVNRNKQRLIERGANAWLRLLHTRDIPWRFDVVEVTVQPDLPPAVHHIHDAF